jgi:hypothetical protein
MKPFASRRPRCFAPIAAACGLALLAAPAAQAFTIENQGATDQAAAARLDPARKFSNSGNGQSTIKQGNTTLQFGARPSFNQRYDSNRMFDPDSRLNDER